MISKHTLEMSLKSAQILPWALRMSSNFTPEISRKVLDFSSNFLQILENHAKTQEHLLVTSIYMCQYKAKEQSSREL